MTKKDYIIIAQALAHSAPIAEGWATDSIADEQHTHVVQAIAEALAKDNPQFNRERFLTTAGVEK